MRAEGRGVRRRRRPRESVGPTKALNCRNVAGFGEQLDADCGLAFPFGPS